MLMRLLKSPLVHFFVVAGLIFAVFSMADDSPAAVSPKEIVLDPAQARAIRDRFSAVWNRPPTAGELDAMFRNWAKEEALVREALALGLDRDDATIRQRLAQKMQYIGESSTAAVAVDDATLQAFMQEKSERFAEPEKFAFDQVLLPEDDDAEQIETLRVALQQGADPLQKGRGAMLPPSVPLTPAPSINRNFGLGFHEKLAKLTPGQWQGPVESAYGLHLVRVTDHRDKVLPQLADIRDRVEGEWRATKAVETREAFTQSLLQRYEVSLPSAAEVLDQ